MKLSILIIRAACLLGVASLCASQTAAGQVELKRDDAAGRLQFLVAGQERLGFEFGPETDLPHFYPMRSPSGKLLTIQKTEPYPHHRSLWFADTVRLASHRTASFYNALYSQISKTNPAAGFSNAIKVAEIKVLPDSRPDEISLEMKLVWLMDKTEPVLDERRLVSFRDLGQGEYLLDLQFTVTASYGDVQFLSDAAHYAWPYVRMHPQFSVEHGGMLVNSEGGQKQAGTHNKPAKWIDYYNTIDGVTEGLAFFSHSENEHPHTWLTRDYGTCGPRRADPRNGKPFALKKGESLKTRVGLLTHRGNTTEAKISERYQDYINNKL